MIRKIVPFVVVALLFSGLGYFGGRQHVKAQIAADVNELMGKMPFPKDSPIGKAFIDAPIMKAMKGH